MVLSCPKHQKKRRNTNKCLTNRKKYDKLKKKGQKGDALMAGLGKKDYDILDFIYMQTKINGFPPSVREIGKEFHLTSTASVYNRIKKLTDAGFLIKTNSKNRALKVVNYTPSGEEAPKINMTEGKTVDVPIIGKVAAGVPITAVEEREEVMTLPASFVRSRDIFVLRVSGESMINAGIYDGDFIMVNHQETAENGDIVVALVNNSEEATVKTFYKEKGHFRLQPENSAMEPIIVDEVRILGKVVGLFREIN